MKLINAVGSSIVHTVEYLLKRVFPFVLGFALLAGVSFVFTGGFTPALWSERVFYLALLVFLVAGTVAMAQMVSGRVLLFPFNIRRPEDAKKYFEQMPAARESAEKRLDAGIQLWLIGLGTLGISALIQTLLGS